MADVRWGEESATAPALLGRAELHPGLAGPGWQMCDGAKNLPQF